MLASQHIVDILRSDVVIARMTESAQFVRSKLGGGVAVVIVAGQLPVAVLPAEAFGRPASGAETLTTYERSMKPATLATRETTVADALEAMQLDKFIRWHVVLDGSTIVGVVSPEEIFSAGDEDDPDRLGGESVSPTPTRLPGDPLTPKLCYRCLVDPGHHYGAREVDRDARGRAICKIDKTFLIAENPCRGKA